MRVLVTGGTGVVGQKVVSALLERGHEVRLLSRHADTDARLWPHRVEAFRGDVVEPESLRGSADGCDAIIHVVGIVSESPPERTFQSVNVEGTRQILAEAERAGVARFVYVSSLGADRGDSPYHRSKRDAEGIVRGFSRSWTIVRPGNVYGPGDGQISFLLQMVRTLPIMPVVGGDAQFQPVWADDLAEALAIAIEREELDGQILEVAGRERVTVDEIIDRFCAITDRSPKRVPLPLSVASVGTRVAELVGVKLPVDSGQLTMLEEGNMISGGIL